MGTRRGDDHLGAADERCELTVRAERQAADRDLARELLARMPAADVAWLARKAAQRAGVANG